MKVNFSEWLEICLKEIYRYYCIEANPNIAFEIVNKIIDRAETLTNYPNRGRIEEELKSLGKGHRYLLEYHYKLFIN